MSDTTNTPAVPSRVTEAIAIIKDVGPWFYAIAVASLYICGFLVLNATLAKYNIFDFDFVNSRYFLTGANFLFFVIVFYLFAGREILFGKKWLSKDLEAMNKKGKSGFWSALAFAHSLISILFACCFSAAFYTSIAFGGAEAAVFYAAVAITFLIRYTLDVTNIGVKHPRFNTVVALLGEMGAIFVFFVLADSVKMITVFSVYFGAVAVINFIADRFDRYRTTKDLLTFTGVYGSVIFLTTAISYGALIYGDASPKIGGARPQEASATLTEDAKKVLTSFKWTSANVFSGKLVYQTPANLYFFVDNKIVRLRVADVVALTVIPEPEGQYVEQMQKKFQKLFNIQPLPNPSSKNGNSPPAAPAK